MSTKALLALFLLIGKLMVSRQSVLTGHVLAYADSQLEQPPH